jgi:hypothetical protein
MGKAATKIESKTPHEKAIVIALMLIEKFGGDRDKTFAALKRKVSEDDELRRWAFHEGARRVLHDAMRLTRLSKITKKKFPGIRASLELTPLKTWRLEDGTLLRAAKRRQLIEAAESLERVSSGILSRAILYRRIAARLKNDDDVVGLRINDDELKAEMKLCESLADKAVRSES